jgi:hypothetical protein
LWATYSSNERSAAGTPLLASLSSRGKASEGATTSACIDPDSSQGEPPGVAYNSKGRLWHTLLLSTEKLAALTAPVHLPPIGPVVLECDALMRPRTRRSGRATVKGKRGVPSNRTQGAARVIKDLYR